MDISDWRRKIDAIDAKLVDLLNERAEAAREIGRLKSQLGMPIYEPKREEEIFGNIETWSKGPLKGRHLVQIYERLIDVMRNLQREEIAPEAPADSGADTELDAEVND